MSTFLGPQTRRDASLASTLPLASGPRSFWDGFGAQVEQTARVTRAGAREDMQRERLWRRHDEAERAAGRPLPVSRFMMGYDYMPGMAPTGTMAVAGYDMVFENQMGQERALAARGSPVVETRRDYEAELERARAEAPERWARIAGAAQFDQELSDELMAIFRRTEEVIDASPMPLAARLLGGVASIALDPVNLAASVLTGGAGAGLGLAGRVAAQAGVNAAIEAGQAPLRMAEAGAIGGPEYTTDMALMDVGAAALFGAGFELGATGIRTVWQRARAGSAAARAARIDRIADPETRFEAQEIQEAAELAALFEDLDAETAELARTALMLDQLRAELGDPLEGPPLEATGLPDLRPDGDPTLAAPDTTTLAPAPVEPAPIDAPEPAPTQPGTRQAAPPSPPAPQRLVLSDEERAKYIDRYGYQTDQRAEMNLIAFNSGAAAGEAWGWGYRWATPDLNPYRKDPELRALWHQGYIAERHGYDVARMQGPKLLSYDLPPPRPRTRNRHGPFDAPALGPVLGQSDPRQFDVPSAAPERTDGLREIAAPGGGRVYQGTVAAAEVEADARTFQYKDNGDAAGVTERLRAVGQWDPAKAGMALIWERRDGRRFIADGHQRLGLAKRLEADGQGPVQLNALVYREVDGWSAPELRLVAAMKNIAEGSGTALDAAKVFRAAGTVDAPDPTLPLTTAVVRDVRDLARLSDEAFGLVTNEVVSVRDAAMVGRIAAANPELHAGILKVIKEGDYRSAAEVESAVRQLLKLRWKDADGAGDTLEMFDTQSLVPELFHERIKVAQAAVTELRKNAVAFKQLVQRADLYETHGNTIDRAAGADVASQSDQLAAIAATVLQRVFDVEGPLREAVDAAARAIARGAKPANAVQPVLEVLEQAAQDRAGWRAMLDADAPTPAQREAVAQADLPDGRELVPDVERDDATLDLFGEGEIAAARAEVEAGQADVKTLGTCGPLKGGAT